jgi:hypothetical protein
VVEWKIAGPWRWIEGSQSLKKQADKTNDGNLYKDQRYTKIDGHWNQARLKPTLSYEIWGFIVLAESKDVLKESATSEALNRR